MDQRLMREYESRIRRTQLEAAQRGYSCLLILALAPRRVGDLLYLTGHQPMMQEIWLSGQRIFRFGAACGPGALPDYQHALL